MVQAALIGVSGFGRVHYTDLVRYHEQGALRLIGATVINPEEEAEKCATLTQMGCRLFDDYTQMLEALSGQIDLCCIPTGIGLHAPMAINAMQHGANCLIEKPAAPCVQDVHAMRREEQRSGCFVAVGFQSIYQPETQQIKKDILAGRIGRLRRVKGIGLWPRDSGYYGRNRWAGKIRNGKGWILDSPFNNALAHYVNLCCFFAGTSFERSAQLDWGRASLFRCNPDIENADSAVLQYVTTAGTHILFYTTHCNEERFGPVIEIQGDEGRIEWSADQVVYHDADGSTETRPIDNETLRVNLMDAVLGRLSDPQRFICDLDIAEQQVLAVNGAHESSPVVPVDPAFIEQRAGDNEGYRYICTGIDEGFRQMYEEERLTDPAFPWIVPGEKVALRDYTEFTGGRTGATA